MGSWLDKVPGGSLLKSAGALTGQFGTKSAGDVVIGGAQGIDKGIAKGTGVIKGIGVEDEVEKAAKILEKVGPEGIPAGSFETGKIIQRAVGAGVDGDAGPKTLLAVNAHLVKRFSPKPEAEASKDSDFKASIDKPAESITRGVMGLGKLLGDGFKAVRDSVTGEDLAKEYPTILKQVEDVIKNTPEGQDPVVLKSLDEISGPHMAFFLTEHCKKNLFDGNKDITDNAAKAIGNEIASATGKPELQDIGHSLAQDLVKAPENFKPEVAEVRQEPEAPEPSGN